MLLAVSSLTAQEARLAHVFQDNMVLQREMSVPVWGWAPAGTEVTVSFAEQKKSAVAGTDGRWQVELAPLPAESEGRPLTANLGSETITRNNVVIGEVWIAAGQSNMNHSGPDQPTGLYPHYQSPGTSDAEIRTIRYGFGASLEPFEDIDPAQRGKADPWEILAPGDFENTNMARYFARVVRDNLDVPVGIVHVAVSGTNQAAWMAKETLEQFPGDGDHANYYEQFLAGMEQGQAKKNVPSFAEFKEKEAAWRETPEGRWPGNRTYMNYPTALYNTRIAPLAPFAVRGVIWHQGEGGPGGPYGERMVAKVRQWRDLFGNDFYFIWGTLTRDTGGVPTLTAAPDWFYRSRNNESIREAVTLFDPDEKFAMVELYDVGDFGTHFLQKAEAGRRMGLAAIDLAYDGDYLYTGPLLTNLELEGATATATFDQVGEGLVYRPSLDGISGFVIKGEDTGYLWAKVELTGPNRIELTHPEVAKVTEVGYANNQNPHETLFNSAGLPASPFKEGLSRVPWSGQNTAPKILEIETSGDAKAFLNLGHVRREGYAFQLMKPGNVAEGMQATVTAFVPGEWGDSIVLVGGEPIETETVEMDHGIFVRFDAPIDNRWVVVARPDQVDPISTVQRY